MSPVLAQHSAATPDWGTPPAIVEMAREVLGAIDCDPCSSAYWNGHVVKASGYYDAERSPLDVKGPEPWPVMTWFINPPGGMVKEFWRFAHERWREGSAVFWVGFSLEQLVYLQRDGALHPRAFRRCIPPKRLAFLMTPASAREKLLEKASKASRKGEVKVGDRFTAKAEAVDLAGPPIVGDAPTHGCYLLLMPSEPVQVERFTEACRRLPAEVF